MNFGFYRCSSALVTKAICIGCKHRRHLSIPAVVAFVPMTVTTRQGARQLSSVSCTGEKIDEVGKKARSKRKTSKVVRTKESLPIIPVNDCDSNDDHDHDHDASRTLKPTPWYHVFTKGDEEYNRYMSTEWGFEKVRVQLLNVSSMLVQC